MPAIILVVEDEPSFQDTLVYNLEKQGYTVESCGGGRSALEAARRLKPDLIVLDIMLPELDGFEVTRILRREMIVPILMLTARDEEIDRVVGLEVGADDYLTKPFSMRELLARVKAQLRRAQLVREEQAKADTGEAANPQDTLSFDNLVINQSRREVMLDGQVLALKPQEYDLLQFFAQHKRQMLSREFILGARLGLGLYRQQPHGGRPRPLAAAEDRSRPLRTGPYCHCPRRRLPLRGVVCRHNKFEIYAINAREGKVFRCGPG